MDHDRDGRISFSDFSTTVQVSLEKNCDRFSKGQRLSIETVFPVQNSFPNLGRFQEEPLLMEAFGPCLPNNRAGGEFIRLDVVKLI